VATTGSSSQGQGGSKIRLSGRTTVIIILGVSLAFGAYLLWRRRNSSATAQAAAAPTQAQQEDFSGQIATLQSEVADLQGVLSQDESGEGGTSGGGLRGQPPGGHPVPRGGKPGVPTGVHATRVTSTSITLAWNVTAGATSYKAFVTHRAASGKTVTGATATSTRPSVTLSAADNRSYTCHVQACNSAGCSAFTTGPVVRTPADKDKRGGGGPGGGEGEDSGSDTGSSGGGESEAA